MSTQLKRRELITLLGGMAFAWTAAAVNIMGASSSGRPPPRPQWHPCRRCR
jgi:hypothetical protein